MIFKSRVEAGEILAEKVGEILSTFKVEAKDVVVLCIPRGGVVVAAEVAKGLGSDLDVVIVRKLGIPSHPEFAFGAVDIEGGVVLDKKTVANVGLTDATIDEVRDREQGEAKRRGTLFRKGRGDLN